MEFLIMANGKITPTKLENGEITDTNVLEEIRYKIETNSNLVVNDDYATVSKQSSGVNNEEN